MHFMTNVCFMCLRNTTIMTPVTRENGVLQKFKNVYPEVVCVDTDLPRNVCKICYLAVNSFYNFKKRSTKTHKRWLGYIRLLQGNNFTEKFADIQIRIYKSDSNTDDIELLEEELNFEETVQVPLIEDNQQKVEVNQQKIDDECQTNQQLSEYNNVADDNSDDDYGKLVIDETQEPKLGLEENQVSVVQTEDDKQQNSNYNECYYCPICKKSLSSKICLTRHFTQQHVRGQDSVTCPLCFKTCKSYFLKHHFRTHIVKALECPICKKQIFRRGNLRSHLKNVHKCLVYISCAVCDQDFFAAEMYDIHVQSQEHLDKMREANMLQSGGNVTINLDDNPQINLENSVTIPMEVA